MDTRTLGNSGIAVNPMGIGLWAMGGTTWGPTDDADSLRTIDRALELGINFFDTADVYGDGHSEVLLGKAMKGRRDRFILATKIGWVGFDGDAGHSGYTSVKKVIEGVEKNLKRLDSDHIDLLQWHVNFRDSTMETFIEGCLELKKQGKVRSFGVSTSDYDYIRAFFGSSQASTLQIDYSILNRSAEQEIFPFCREQGIGTIIRGGLAMGILTGKFSRDSRFSKDDFRNAWIEDPAQHEQFLKDMDTMDALKQAFPGEDLAVLALRFLLSNPAVTVVIPGAKRVSQLENNFKAAEKGVLSAAEMDTINAIVAPGGGRKIWPA